MTPDEHFEVAVETVLRHEGGYSFHPSDPGGETKFGITKRQYPDLDIKNLTLREAKEIYRRDYWIRYGFDRITDPIIATKVFDLGVNVGPKHAVEFLQRGLHACGLRYVTIDGRIGPQTLAAIEQADTSNLLVAIRAEAAAHYRALIEKDPALERFSKGWFNRAYA